jgi:hypothetical protein
MWKKYKNCRMSYDEVAQCFFIHCGDDPFGINICNGYPDFCCIWKHYSSEPCPIRCDEPCIVDGPYIDPEGCITYRGCDEQDHKVCFGDAQYCCLYKIIDPEHPCPSCNIMKYQHCIVSMNAEGCFVYDCPGQFPPHIEICKGDDEYCCLRQFMEPGYDCSPPPAEPTETGCVGYDPTRTGEGPQPGYVKCISTFDPSTKCFWVECNDICKQIGISRTEYCDDAPEYCCLWTEKFPNEPCVSATSWTQPTAAPDYHLSIGNKHYELSNHLGYVLTTISDRKIGKNYLTSTGNIDYFYF